MLTPEQLKFLKDYLVEHGLLDTYVKAIVHESARQRVPNRQWTTLFCHSLTFWHGWSNTNTFINDKITYSEWSVLSDKFSRLAEETFGYTKITGTAEQLAELLKPVDTKKQLRLAIRKIHANTRTT